MNSTAAMSGRLKCFAYVTADKAALYRAMMRVFTDAKARFALHLRPQEILAALQDPAFALPVEVASGGGPESNGETNDWSGDCAVVDAAGVDAALNQLCQWGNLESHPDTADVATVEEFYRPRFLFQLTREGEAAERAIALFHEAIRQPGELQAAALGDIQALLAELAQLAESAEPDHGKVHRTLSSLRVRFEELTSKAQSFIGSLQRTIDLHGIGVDAFLAYKQSLIEYLERFIGELVIAAADIAARLERAEELNVDRLLVIAARRDLADALSPTEDDHQAAVRLWLARWAGLRAWFIGRGDAPSQAEVLRARARSSIPALLSAVAGINDRRVARSDRSTDLRVLARWFAETDSEADAHRLWRAAFGLTPARHLLVDDDTLAERDGNPVAAQTSWLDAPPLEISPRLRASGRYARPGRSQSVIDFSAEKAMLAAAAALEAEQIAAARRRLAQGRRMRLSEIGKLDADEFHLFLDLLGEALASKILPTDTVDTMSTDGTLWISLAPTRDGAPAVIQTSMGTFAGEDHFLTVRDALARHGAPARPAAGLAARLADETTLLGEPSGSLL